MTEVTIHAFERKKLRLYGPVPEGGHWHPRWNSEICGLYKDLIIVDGIEMRRLGPACYVIRMDEQRIRKKRVLFENLTKQDQ
jgi:hypothetical protein